MNRELLPPPFLDCNIIVLGANSVLMQCFQCPSYTVEKIEMLLLVQVDNFS